MRKTMFAILLFVSSLHAYAELKPIVLGFGSLKCSYALQGDKLKLGAEQWLYGYLTSMASVEALHGHDALSKVVGEISNQDVTAKAAEFCKGSPDKLYIEAVYAVYRMFGGTHLVRY